MTVWIEILVLAVVQGIAEFLPISSSGHVVLGAALFDHLGQPLHEKLTVNVVLHLGTLLAILVFYWGRIIRLLGRDRRVIGLLVVGSLPIALVGMVVKKTDIGPTIEAGLESALVAGLMFPITGAMLVWASRRPQGDTTCCELRYRAALAIGVFQAFAVLPGISRSGATLAAALGCGMRREEAAAFSFLLAIPAIAGAGLLETLDIVAKSTGSTSVGGLAAGAAVAFVVGLASLWWLVRWLKQGRLHRFAWYLFPLGAAVLVWQLLLLP